MNAQVAVRSKQLLLSLTDQLPWAVDFQLQLAGSPDCAKAFDKLIAAGCDPSDLLFWLDLSCRSYVSQYAVKRRDIREKVAEVCENLLTVAKRLSDLESSRPNREMLKSLRLPQFEGFSAKLREYAECLLSEVTEADAVSVRETNRLSTAFLVASVEGRTSRKHYADIARLMEAHLSMQGIQKDISTQSIKRKVKRFCKGHPLSYSHMRNMSKRQQDTFDIKPRFPEFMLL